MFRGRTRHVSNRRFAPVNIVSQCEAPGSVMEVVGFTASATSGDDRVGSTFFTLKGDMVPVWSALGFYAGRSRILRNGSLPDHRSVTVRTLLVRTFTFSIPTGYRCGTGENKDTNDSKGKCSHG